MAESHKYLKLVKTPSRHIAGGMALEEWQPIWHHLRGKGSIVRAAKCAGADTGKEAEEVLLR